MAKWIIGFIITALGVVADLLSVKSYLMQTFNWILSNISLLGFICFLQAIATSWLAYLFLRHIKSNVSSSTSDQVSIRNFKLLQDRLAKTQDDVSVLLAFMDGTGGSAKDIKMVLESHPLLQENSKVFEESISALERGIADAVYNIHSIRIALTEYYKKIIQNSSKIEAVTYAAMPIDIDTMLSGILIKMNEIVRFVYRENDNGTLDLEFEPQETVAIEFDALCEIARTSFELVAPDQRFIDFGNITDKYMYYPTDESRMTNLDSITAVNAYLSAKRRLVHYEIRNYVGRDQSE